MTITEIYILRHLLDAPGDGGRLVREICDLSKYPHKLRDEYKLAWLSYVKLRLRELRKAPKIEQEMFWRRFQLWHRKPSSNLIIADALNKINLALDSIDMKNEIEIKIPVQTYVGNILSI